MLPGPFRFVHASDLHLERPLAGLSQTPEALREALIEAPYRAAEHVFDAAIAEQADFVVLSGDVLHVETAGPRGLAFLVSQFERLAKHGIRVYWAGGHVDPPAAWPAALELPPTVHVFSDARPEDRTHSRDGQALARLTGWSRRQRRPIRADDFWPDAGGLFSVAVAHGAADRAALSSRGIHYWALGGMHSRQTLLSGSHVAHYPGTPQGRQAEDVGPHGCSLVQVGADGHPRVGFIPADAMRWCRETIHADDAETCDAILRRMRSRMEELVASSPGVTLLVQWRLVVGAAQRAALRRGPAAESLLASRVHDFGAANPPAWTLGVSVETSEQVWQEELAAGSLAADFLEVVGEYGSNDFDPLALGDAAGLGAVDRECARVVETILKKEGRARSGDVRRQVVELGADLLLVGSSTARETDR